jgi:ABC-type Fe3+ transport system permease subunit
MRYYTYHSLNVEGMFTLLAAQTIYIIVYASIHHKCCFFLLLRTHVSGRGFAKRSNQLLCAATFVLYASSATHWAVGLIFILNDVHNTTTLEMRNGATVMFLLLTVNVRQSPPAMS